MEDLNSKFSGREATRPGQKPKSAQARGGLKPWPRRAAVITSLFSGPNLLSFLLLALMGLLDCAAWGGSIGTAFTYQGRLQDGTNAASGLYDLRFAVYDAASAGNQVGLALTNSTVAITNGVFTVLLDFGANVFTGQALWLESAVRTNGGGTFSLLPPREPLTAAPYALYATNAGVALSVAAGGVTSAALAPGAVSANQIASGQVVKSLNGLADDVALVPGANIGFTTNANTLIISAAGGGPTGGWSTTGNAGTTPGVNFLGTTDDQPLELSVSGWPGLRLEPTGPESAPNLVGGYLGTDGNSVAPGVVGAVIAGGGAGPLFVPPRRLTFNNSVLANYGIVAGGLQNVVKGPAGVVSGGQANSVETNGAFGAIPGGDRNQANGTNSFAAGHRAKAMHDGSFVWADGTDADFSSTGANQFLVRANGGVGIGTNNPQSALHVAGAVTARAFGGNWQVVTEDMTTQPNCCYLVNASNPVTLTLPASPAVGDTLRISGAGASGWRLAQNPGQRIQTRNLGGTGIGSVWIPKGENQNWNGIACSADGTKLVAFRWDLRGHVYICTSTDSGATWTQRESHIGFSWGVASSADGSKLAAVVGGGSIYTSTDSGATWTARETSRNWRAVASSADGTKLVAVVFQGQIYTSTDSGATWTPRESSRNWLAVASSADGTKLVAVVEDGWIYTSTDSGATWTARDSSRQWGGVASSADGTKLVAIVFGGQIYTSTDSGATWTASESSREWIAVASSADGSKLVAAVNMGYIYTSTDSGVSWTAHESCREWTVIACSADGAKLYVAPVVGQLYTATGSTSLGTSGLMTGDQYSALELQYIGNGDFMPLSSVGSLLSF